MNTQKMEQVVTGNHNSDMHTLNGNLVNDIVRKQINVLQINRSNANFNTKIDELVEAISKHESKIVIVIILYIKCKLNI